MMQGISMNELCELISHKEIIDAVLSEKCFDGKSFLEIEQEITVTVIY